MVFDGHKRVLATGGLEVAQSGRTKPACPFIHDLRWDKSSSLVAVAFWLPMTAAGKGSSLWGIAHRKCAIHILSLCNGSALAML